MLKKIVLISFISAAVFSCSSPSKKVPVTDMEVATAFIRDILDNKFDDAEQFLLKNETNKELFSRFKKDYSTKKEEVLEKYKKADILVNETSYVTDSIFIFNYSNSYTKEAKNLKLVRVNGKWLVDFQYTFSGNL
ncbi:MAG: hypothetical protein IPP96_06800 [Chitinophagaceae bacterium]|nr:hypothetical protein [Chitinophagaceae bacterium]